MKYAIRIGWNTGDSFHTESGLYDDIELGWSDIKVVEENVKRIEDHYKWYLGETSSWRDRVEKPKWLKYDEPYSHRINLKLDNGSEHSYGAFWTGYFESLNSIEIVGVNTIIDARDW